MMCSKVNIWKQQNSEGIHRHPTDNMTGILNRKTHSQIAYILNMNLCTNTRVSNA